MSQRPKRPRDPNQLAKSIVDIATGQREEDSAQETGDSKSQEPPPKKQEQDSD